MSQFFLASIILCSLFSRPVFAAQTKVPPTISAVQTNSIFVGIDNKGRPAYFALSNGEARQVSREFVNSAIGDLIEALKREACGLKIRPDSVTGSIGFLSFTWETARLCEK